MKTISFFLIVLTWLAACTQPQPQATTAASARQLAAAIVRHTNAGTNDSLSALYADSAKIYVNGNLVLTGNSKLKEALDGNKKQFPDLSIEATAVFTDGDHLIMEQRTTGTHTGPDNKGKTTIHNLLQHQVRIEVIKNGKITEERFYLDNLAFMRQMGQLK